MILLVTDTSGKNGTVALARTGERDLRDIAVLEVVPLAGGMFSAQLVPQIAALLQKHGLSKSDLDGFVVVSGPGSFTGLRVGLAAVKALAEILQKPIAAVSLLELIASASRSQGRVVAVLDGGRGEVFFGAYEITGDSLQVLREELLSKAEFLSHVGEGVLEDVREDLRGVVVATPDSALAAASREAGLSVFALEPLTAGMIASFGWKKLQAGVTVSPEQLEANYMRRSDAEIFVKKSS
jgi:tRNA threonylcarbamoyladenosine biosynthesis protein TsaB